MVGMIKTGVIDRSWYTQLSSLLWSSLPSLSFPAHEVGNRFPNDQQVGDRIRVFIGSFILGAAR